MLVLFLLFPFITSCACVCFIAMERRTVSRVTNESDEDVPVSVSDYSDDSDYEKSEPSDDNDDPDPLNRFYIFSLF